MAEYMINGGFPGVSAGVNNEARTTEELKFAEEKAHAEMCMKELRKVYGDEIPKIYVDFFAKWLG